MRLVFVSILLLLIAVAPARGAVRETSVTYRSGEIELAAAFLVPEGPGPFPAAVIVQGSGASDRTNAWARAIAETLAESGLAVLLTDKRGSGRSGGDWQTAGFDELATDALAGVAFLAARPEIDARRIGIAGLSQGGRIVPIAAARSDSVAFVINLVGDAVSFGEQSAHEMRNIARQAGLDEAMTREVLQLNAAAGRALLTGDWSDYRRLREAGLRAPWARIAEGFPPPGAPIWTFLGKVADFDPMSYWILVRQPVLIVYGAEDERDNVAVSESVRRLLFGFGQVGKRNYRLVVVPGVGHNLGLGSNADDGPGAAAEAIRDWLGRTLPGLADGGR